MRKLLALPLLFVAAVALAQYGPPGYPNGNSTVGFQPLAKTSAVAASTTSASVAIGNATGSLMTQIQVYNGANQAAFVVFCAAAPCTASVGSAGTQTSDYPIAPGAVIVMTVPTGTTLVGVVLSSGTGTVYFTPGVGL